MSRASLDIRALRAEAESLAAFLRAELPAFARTHRDVTMETDAPTIPAELWKAVGWSEIFAQARLAPPERNLGELKIVARLAEYRSWGDGFALRPEDLPSPRRLVEDDGQGVGFLITDEQDDGLDAPVKAVLAQKNRVVTESGSYARWCANEMVSLALSRLYSTWLAPEPADALESLSTCPWPLLSPATRRFNADVYAKPPDAMATQAHRQGGWTIAHRSVEALVAVLHGAPLETLTLSMLPGDTCAAAPNFAKLIHPEDALRPFPDDKGRTNWVGTFCGIAVIAHESATRTTIAVNPRRLADVQTALRERSAST